MLNLIVVAFVLGLAIFAIAAVRAAYIVFCLPHNHPSRIKFMNKRRNWRRNQPPCSAK